METVVESRQEIENIIDLGLDLQALLCSLLDTSIPILRTHDHLFCDLRYRRSLSKHPCKSKQMMMRRIDARGNHGHGRQMVDLPLGLDCARFMLCPCISLLCPLDASLGLGLRITKRPAILFEQTPKTWEAMEIVCKLAARRYDLLVLLHRCLMCP